MFNSNCASVPLVANVDGNNGSGFFGDGGAWWIVVFVLFIAFGGWGNGFGGFGGGGNNLPHGKIRSGQKNSTRQKRPNVPTSEHLNLINF